jgi:hypothetical protein
VIKRRENGLESERDNGRSRRETTDDERAAARKWKFSAMADSECLLVSQPCSVENSSVDNWPAAAAGVGRCPAGSTQQTEPMWGRQEAKRQQTEGRSIVATEGWGWSCVLQMATWPGGHGVHFIGMSARWRESKVSPFGSSICSSQMPVSDLNSTILSRSPSSFDNVWSARGKSPV